MQNCKRLLSIFLTLSVCLSFAMPCFAEGEQVQTSIDIAKAPLSNSNTCTIPEYANLPNIESTLKSIPVEDIDPNAERIECGSFSIDEMQKSLQDYNFFVSTEFTTYGDWLWQMDELLDESLLGPTKPTPFGAYAKQVYDLLVADVQKGSNSTLLQGNELPVLQFDGASRLDRDSRNRLTELSCSYSYFAMGSDLADSGAEGISRSWLCGYYVMGDEITIFVQPFCEYEYTDYNTRTSLEARSTAIANALANDVNGKSDKEKVLYFANWLANNNTYNHAAADNGMKVYNSVAPWSMMSALLGPSDASIPDPVCEGYSRAFDKICKAANIPCILVSGDNHMWNNVYLDGQWYGIDVTWADQDRADLWMDYMFSTTLNGSYGHSVESFDGFDFPVPKLGVRAIHPETEVWPADPEQIANVNAFVTRFYQNILGRTPAAEEVGYWTNLLITKECSAATVLQGFLESPEYISYNRSDEDYITDLYTTILGRTPDDAGFDYWCKDFLAQGVTRNYVASRFTCSNEFADLCKQYGIEVGTYNLTLYSEQNINLTKFVANVYIKMLGRPFDAEGVNYWTGMVLAHGAAPVDVARSFAFSPEFVNKNHSDTEYVQILYRTFFGREADPDGLNYWLNHLQNGLTREDVLNSFSYSNEFKEVMNSFGL